MKNIFTLVFLIIAYAGCTQQTNFIICGIEDIDQIRKEVKSQPTTPDNALSRRAALYRWWRLMWHQGYDMNTFDEVADMLLNLPDSSPNGQTAITAGFMKMEEIMLTGKRIPEIRGEKSRKSSSVTNWPLYHGTDATQTGYSPDEGPSLGNIAWKFPKSYGCEISPVIDSGMVYIPGVGDDVIAYCLDEISGKVIWKGRKYGTQFYGSGGLKNRALLSDDNMLVTSGYQFKIFERATGKIVKQNELLEKNSGQEDIQLQILKTGNNGFSGINAKTGKMIRWIESSKNISEHGFTSNIKGSKNGILGISQNMMLYSVSPKTGELQWRHGLLDGVFFEEKFYASEELGGQQSSPAVVDGIMYIGGTDGIVNAIDVKTGKEKWRFETEGIIASSPTVAFGKVFFGEAYDASGTYYALDKETGLPIWESEAYGNVWVNATFDNKNIYFGNMLGNFFAVNPENGKPIWKYNTAKDTPLEHLDPGVKHGHGFPPGVYCNPVYKNGVVYTGSWAGYYFAFDANSGELKWRTKTQPEGVEGGGLPDSAAPVLYKNHLYVQKGGWKIAAINIETGLIDWEWSVPVGYLQNGTVTAFNDKIYGSMIRRVTDLPYDASIVAFNDVENGGKELWRYQGGGGLTAAVATNDKLIFGSSGDVFVTCLNPENGEVKWRTYTGGMMLESVPAIYGNKAFVQCKNGYIYAFE